MVQPPLGELGLNLFALINLFFFFKGRNIGNNIRLILDIIDYTDFNDIPGAISLLDIKKAFDSVDHDFLFQVLKHLNFGDQFISWIKIIYSFRKS